jgi:hypothetical protein
MIPGVSPPRDAGPQPGLPGVGPEAGAALPSNLEKVREYPPVLGANLNGYPGIVIPGGDAGASLGGRGGSAGPGIPGLGSGRA